MHGKIIQGFFLGGAARPLPGARIAAPVQAKPSQIANAPTLAGPPRPAFAGSVVAQRFGGAGSFAVDPVQLGLARGGGSPLPEALLAKMEAAFDADFSGVRIHVGPQAARIGAIAFTTGNDLYFAPGRYQPDSVQGQQLIGHELAHVIQQRQGRVRTPGSGVSVVQDHALEAEADRLGMRAAMHRGPVQAKLASGSVKSPTRHAAAPIQRKPDFVIPAHFTGEQYITKAALLVNPRATVTVYAAPDAIEDQYRKDAELIGVTFFQIYNRRHRTNFLRDEDAKAHLVDAQQAQLARTVAYMRSGLERADERVRVSDRPLDTMTSGSTQAVRDAYKRNPQEASKQILDNIESSVPRDVQIEILRYFFRKGFRLGGKYVLFWGRRSGEAVGAGAYLDTNEQMIAQMMITIRLKDPSRRFVLIGDEINIPRTIDGMAVPPIDLSLVAYWRNGLPGNGDVNAQLYFLNLLAMATDTVAIGTNSGILEIPHLLGMATVYLENTHLHKRKGLRWQLLAHKYEFEQSDGDIRSLIRRRDGAKANKQKALDDELRSSGLQRVSVGNRLRPRLVRFSTTGATELWVTRKQVLGGIKAWILRASSGGQSAAKEAPPEHDALLQLIVHCDATDDEEVGPRGNRVSYDLLHQVKRQWAAINASKAECLSMPDLRLTAVTAIDRLIRRHALTAQEVDRFWETFNYTYVNENMRQAPDFRAGMRAWLRDSEQVWNTIKNKGTLGTRVDLIRAEMAREEAEERARREAAQRAQLEQTLRGTRDWLAQTQGQWLAAKRRYRS